jgi:hypothetical protein
MRSRPNPGTFAGLSAMTHLQCELHCPLTPVTVRYFSPRGSVSSLIQINEPQQNLVSQGETTRAEESPHVRLQFASCRLATG